MSPNPSPEFVAESFSFFYAAARRSALESFTGFDFFSSSLRYLRANYSAVISAFGASGSYFFLSLPIS